MMTKPKSRLTRAALFFAVVAGVGAVVSYRMSTVYSVHVTHASVYTVQSGDTLWNIAQHTDGKDYTPAVVSWIEQHNAVQDDVVQEGQRLLVP